MTTKPIRKHFVTFYSPGAFVAETSELPIVAWDVDEAKRMAKGVQERYGAMPYGFRFSTRGRTADELDSTVIAKSPMYFLCGTVETLAEVKARATEKDKILVSNMECNNLERIITNRNSWAWTQALKDNDVVLEWP